MYSEIAAIVERKRGEDASTGNTVAAALVDCVTRKVVKQTVMTTVYGVTRYGAGLQIAKQLRALDNFQGGVEASSKYLAGKTFESLNELFTASQEIQSWLTECAGVVAGECGENVSWLTPLGLPVVQPYCSLIAKRDPGIDIEMTNIFRVAAASLPVERVNKMKHRNGFPPNFIHSLDSSHMMLTSLHLWSHGLTFASVHDCYWTHARDVDAMNSVCRGQFIALHSSPILEDLSDYLLRSHMEEVQEDSSQEENLEKQKKEMLFKQVPSKGQLDLEVVRGSTFFFS